MGLGILGQKCRRMGLGIGLMGYGAEDMQVLEMQVARDKSVGKVIQLEMSSPIIISFNVSWFSISSPMTAVFFFAKNTSVLLITSNTFFVSLSILPDYKYNNENWRKPPLGWVGGLRFTFFFKETCKFQKFPYHMPRQIKKKSFFFAFDGVMEGIGPYALFALRWMSVKKNFFMCS